MALRKEDQLKLAETLYYMSAQKNAISTKWEDAAEETRTMWRDTAGMIEAAVASFGYEITPQGSVRPPQYWENMEEPKLRGLIEQFVATVKHPKGVAELFPSDELTMRILREFSSRPRQAVVAEAVVNTETELKLKRGRPRRVAA